MRVVLLYGVSLSLRGHPFRVSDMFCVVTRALPFAFIGQAFGLFFHKPSA